MNSILSAAIVTLFKKIMSSVKKRKITSIQTECIKKYFFLQPSQGNLFYHQLLKLYLTIPVTTASAERNVSSLEYVKTDLRNSTAQLRLNHCMLLHIHTENLNLKDISEEFIKCNDERITFFGNVQFIMIIINVTFVVILLSCPPIKLSFLLHCNRPYCCKATS